MTVQAPLQNAASLSPSEIPGPASSFDQRTPAEPGKTATYVPAAMSCETAAATRQTQQAGFCWSAGRRVIQSGDAGRAVAVSFAGSPLGREAR